MSDKIMEDPEILDYTQSLRQRMIDSFCEGGKITKDPKELAILERTLSSMDKQVFSKARQATMDREVDNNEQAQQYIMEMFDSMDRNRGRLESSEGTGNIPEPDLGDAEEDVNEGSMETGISEESYETFKKRMED